MTVQLALLSRVSYGSLEITGSRLQDLLALLAEDPHGGCSTSRLVDALSRLASMARLRISVYNTNVL